VVSREEVALMAQPIDIPVVLPETNHPDRARLRLIGRKVRKRLAAEKSVRKIAVDKAELWALAGFLDALECGRLISIIDKVAEPSKAYEVDYSSGIRTSYSSDLDPRDPFIRMLERRIDALLGFDPANGETLQGQRYDTGQEFKPHTDWFVTDSAAWEQERDHGRQRSFTAMAYLNDVAEGGETDFPNLGIAVAPRAGTLLIWNNADEEGVPSSWVVHAGNPVMRGKKYVITKWYRCEQWVPL
jgi:prolyl 4-hydroxylase